MCISCNSYRCLFVALFSICCSYVFSFQCDFLQLLMSASHCIVFIFSILVFLLSFADFLQQMLPTFHCILSFWCSCVPFVQCALLTIVQLILIFLCILSILLFLVSFSLVHTSCIFLLSAFHCNCFDNQLFFFNGYTSISVHFNFAHCYEHLLSFNLLFLKKFNHILF